MAGKGLPDILSAMVSPIWVKNLNKFQQILTKKIKRDENCPLLLIENYLKS